MLSLFLANVDPEAFTARTEGFLGGIMDTLARMVAVFEGAVFKAGIFVGFTLGVIACVLLYLHAEHSRKPKP